MTSDQHRGLIIGVGTEYGDDAFGLLVARHLAGRIYPGVDIITHAGEGASLMEVWLGYESVVIVDAGQSGAPLGTRFRFDASSEKIPTKFLRYSTHAFGVAEAIETARALGRLPRRMIVFAVEGETFQAGASVNPLLGSLVVEVAALALAEISNPERRMPQFRLADRRPVQLYLRLAQTSWKGDRREECILHRRSDLCSCHCR